MGNIGYQGVDREIVDYQLWNPAGTPLWVRGPQIDLSGSYFSCLGAAQTFGRFCQVPFPTLLSKNVDIPVLNFGFSGAGPQFFRNRERALELVNRGRFSVVQCFSGRSVENSVFSLGVNQGIVVWKSGPNAGKKDVAEFGYRDYISLSKPSELAALREETRSNYVDEMTHLLGRIHVPKILLYFSTRRPEYVDGVENVGQYLSEFPHFINRDVVERLKSRADGYVEVVSRSGLPQDLVKLGTAEPAVVWPEDKFPHVQQRTQNNYYPSPEMHSEVAMSLESKLREMGLV